MIKELIKLANHLDKTGFEKEADYLDKVIKKYSQEQSLVSTDDYGISASDMIANIKKDIDDISKFYLEYFLFADGQEAQIPISIDGNPMVPNPMYIWYSEQCVGEVGSTGSKGEIGGRILGCYRTTFTGSALNTILDMRQVMLYDAQEIKMSRPADMDQNQNSFGKITTWPENNPLLDRPIEGRSGTYQFFSTYKAQMKRLIELAEAELRLAKD